ncbi:MAG: ABC transporter permease [Bacilli bacterium]|nr:ABC transporter permease [Bacilli bacterium]
MSNILITFKKELRSILRDKKTLLSLFIFPIMIPVMIVLYGTIYDNIENEETNTNIGVNYTVSENEKTILDSLNMTYSEYKSEEEMQKEYENGNITAYISYNEDENKYTIYSDMSGTDGMTANALIYEYLEAYSQTLTNEYLLNQNINLEEAYNHFTIEEKELGNNNYVITLVLSISLTYTILSICMATGNMAVAATASEKENGTLETILTFPIKKTELIIGKYFSSVAIGMIAGLVSLIFMIAGLFVAKSHYTIFENFELILNSVSIIGSILTIISASIFIGGIALVLTAFTKSYKEAQSKISSLTMLAMIPMFISLMGIEVTKTYYLIPICNYVQVLNDLFTNSINMTNVLITTGSTIIYVIIVITYIVKAYNSEKILFTD